ncbi:hypothetical protein PVL29_005584 [Vitis rotundifolia]|uniref:Uncharacterized protein n=1 Tax=Vitis rotundifolia TaxID=103349 RepID=A0AA39A2X3_VITRO|nr:hypothetical protein PVL29_005584 [Vitis rotundifolia]
MESNKINTEMESSKINTEMESSKKPGEEIILVHDELVSTIKEKMDTVFPHCICRVPEIIAQENKKAYYPELISIGPFHHGREELKGMEDHKWRYLHALLSRKPNLEASLAICVKALRECERKARNCYAEKETIKLSCDEFVTMMLVDGCFIIELFLKYAYRSLRKRGDPIFTLHERFRTLRCDMILLENQYPLFVLQRLFNLVPIPPQSKSLNGLAFHFFRTIIPGNKKATKDKFSQEGNHLLDLIHNCFLPTFSEVHPAAEKPKPQQQRSKPQEDQPPASEKLKSASKLHDSGIKLRKVNEGVVLDIAFENGLLYIPEVKIHQYTETLFRNLIAGERCNCDNFVHVTSYVFLLSKLISSPKDVKFLRQKKILTSSLEKDNDVSELFKNLSKEVKMNQFHFEGLCEQVKEYKSGTWFTLPSCLQK